MHISESDHVVEEIIPCWGFICQIEATSNSISIVSADSINEAVIVEAT